jgi:hypothetical protein
MASTTVRDAALKAAKALDSYALCPDERSWGEAREALLLLAMTFPPGLDGPNGRDQAGRRGAAGERPRERLGTGVEALDVTALLSRWLAGLPGLPPEASAPHPAPGQGLSA